MAKRFTNPFAPLELTSEDATQLEGLADAFVRKSIAQYERYAVDDQRAIDDKRWKPVLQRDDVRVFCERREREILADVELPDVPVTSATTDLPSLLLCGSIRGTLSDAVFGYITPTLDWMRIKTSYIDDQLVSSAILATLVAPSAADPFRSLTIKWIEKGRPLHVRAVVKNRDFVYMDASGLSTLSTGERIGYHVLHSVHFPQTLELDTNVRGNMSFCGIYRQRPNNTIDVYIRGVLNPAGGLMRSIVISSAAQAIVSSCKYVHCAEMKKLAWLLRQRTSSAATTANSGQQHTDRDVVVLGGRTNTNDTSDRSSDGSSSRRRRSSDSASNHTTAAAAVHAACGACGKKPSTLASLVSKPRATCQICLEPLCSACKRKRTLSFIAATDQRLVQSELTFCARCIAQATRLDAAAIAVDELVAPHPFTWKDAYAHSSASSASSSSELSPTASFVSVQQQF